MTPVDYINQIQLIAEDIIRRCEQAKANVPIPGHDVYYGDWNNTLAHIAISHKHLEALTRYPNNETKQNNQVPLDAGF